MGDTDPFMEAMDKKLDKIGVDIVYLREETVRNEEWHKTLNDDLKEVHAAVYGNGNIGLKQELQCIDSAVGDINDRLSHIEDDKKQRDTLKTTTKLEWLRGWRAVFFTGLTVLISTAITLGVGGYFRAFAP